MPEGINSLCPEIQWRTVGIISTETIHIGSKDPVFHIPDHEQAHSRVGIIELGNIIPSHSRRTDDIPQAILQVPVLVAGDPAIVPVGMVCNPVKNDTHIPAVGAINKGA